MWESKGIKWMVVGLLILAVTMSPACALFNHPPEITSLTPSATSVARGGSCTITCDANDPDGDTLTFEWTATGGAISGTGGTVTWTAPTTEGSYTISVTVSDGKGGTVSDSVSIQVINSPPEITSLTPSATSVAPSESCTITCVANDPDDDTLTYAWTATGGTISGTGGTVTWIAPAAEGSYTISVTVSDGKGGTATDSCAVTVEVKFGSIDIKSSPSGAAVYLDGEDIGNITPYVITGIDPGSYTIKLVLSHYKYREGTVTVNANETTYINWSLTYAPEETATIQPDAAEGKDTSVSKYYPDYNFPNRDWITAGRGTADTCRAYLKFDLSDIPDDAVVTSARVELYYWGSDAPLAAPIGVYRVEEPWSEGSVTWNNQPEFATTPEYTRNVPASPTNSFLYWYISDLVKGWWDGSIHNYGIMLKDTDESTAEAWKRFYSSDWSTADQRPKLLVNYYDPTS